MAKSATTEEAEHKAYDEAAKAQPPEPEVHARHILLPTEEEAKAALARIKAGEDFAKVATELSKDTAGDGGDLGWFTKDRMVPEFADAAFKLEPGQVSDPVKSQFGWHIIKVEAKRMKTFPPFEQVKDQAGALCRAKSADGADHLVARQGQDRTVRRGGQAGRTRQTGRSRAFDRPGQTEDPVIAARATF